MYGNELRLADTDFVIPEICSHNHLWDYRYRLYSSFQLITMTVTVANRDFNFSGLDWKSFVTNGILEFLIPLKMLWEIGNP